MLSKPFTSPEPQASNPTARAGWQAEKDLAFFLDRAFKADEAVLLFHSLRLKLPDAHATSEDDFAQIDHLILHRHGIVIVESKSLTGEVQINEHGEFTRKRGNATEGIPSPLRQAQRQGEALRRVLTQHQEQLRGNFVFGLIKGGFRNCPIQPLVAISTHSVLTGAGRAKQPEVHKADAIPDAARAIIDRHRNGARLLSLKTDGNWGMYFFTDEELPRICSFLLAQDVPLRAASGPRPMPAPAPLPRPASKGPTPGSASVLSPALEALTCRHCRSVNIEAVYRKDYCLLCAECAKYTPLDPSCPACRAKARIRKDGPEFRRECACGHAAVFWRNP